MKAFLTSRAEIEIFGKKQEKEDIIPVDIEKDDENVSFKIGKNEFIKRLIETSRVFAVNVPMFLSGREELICQIHEGEFEDKFKISGLEKEECKTIDSPCIAKATVYECSLAEIKEDEDGFEIIGRIIE